jgi:thiamine biosynthesis lipoprotein
MKKVYRISGILLVIIAILSLLYFYERRPKRFEETRSLMDTYVTIIAYGDKNTPEAIDEAFHRMKEIEEVASIYDSQSEAFLLNKNGHIDHPSKDLVYLMNESLCYFNLTGGSFDITVQPFLDLWEEGLWKEDKAIQQKKIDETFEIVGSEKIAIEKGAIYFKKKGMKITLGGIAKGYAVDEALKILKHRGIKGALINAGGDIGTIGSRGAEGWTIALENPDDPTQCIAKFRISNKAVATSGNYERYFDPNKKFHYIINPKTGYSTNECISVTIIADSCIEADALATGVFVLGPKKGIQLIEFLPEVEGLIIDSNRNIYRSSGLAVYEGSR